MALRKQHRLALVATYSTAVFCYDSHVRGLADIYLDVPGTRYTVTYHKPAVSPQLLAVANLDDTVLAIQGPPGAGARQRCQPAAFSDSPTEVLSGRTAHQGLHRSLDGASFLVGRIGPFYTY
jgi:hypothetical protein